MLCKNACVHNDRSDVIILGVWTLADSEVGVYDKVLALLKFDLLSLEET